MIFLVISRVFVIIVKGVCLGRECKIYILEVELLSMIELFGVMRLFVSLVMVCLLEEFCFRWKVVLVLCRLLVMVIICFW